MGCSFKIDVHFPSALFLHLAHYLEFYQMTSCLLLISSHLVLDHTNLEICKTFRLQVLLTLRCLYRFFKQNHRFNGVPIGQHLLTLLKADSGQFTYFPRAFGDPIYVLPFLKASLNKPQLLNFPIQHVIIKDCVLFLELLTFLQPFFYLWNHLSVNFFRI